MRVTCYTYIQYYINNRNIFKYVNINGGPKNDFCLAQQNSSNNWKKLIKYLNGCPWWVSKLNAIYLHIHIIII